MSFQYFTSFFGFLVVACLTEGAIVKHVFQVSYLTASPDGVSTPHILAVNGQFPGPTIEAFIGDTIEVTVINKIQDKQNVTLHWHGLHQKGSLFEDGTSQVTQCPLPYNESQLYRFQVTESGTYWYHSHVRSQYTAGLFGALIVHNTPEPYQYDGEFTLILNDWFQRSMHDNENWHLSPASEGLSPYPDSVLINGRGRYPCPFADLQNRSCAGADQLRPVYTVQANTTYRVRVIHAGAMVVSNFSIDGHTLECIEVDGIDVAVPVKANVATISPGQRYSFLVHPHQSNSGEESRFLIRSVLRLDLMHPRTDTAENINKYPEATFSEATAVLNTVDRDLSGSIHLVEESLEEFSYLEMLPPAFHEIIDGSTEEIVYLNEVELLPLDGIPAPDYFDHEFVLIGGNVTLDGVLHATFNSTPFQLPDHKPVIFSLLEDDEIPQSIFPLEVKNGSVVQIVIDTIGTHPFHLHGHSFWVVGMGQHHDIMYDSRIHKLNVNAMKRDTVYPIKWAVIRFIADNPGIWTFHCHQDWHNLSGMAVTIVAGVDIIKETVRPTDEALRVCGLHNSQLWK